jgi:hypothetical protein
MANAMWYSFGFVYYGVASTHGISVTQSHIRAHHLFPT